MYSRLLLPFDIMLRQIPLDQFLLRLISRDLLFLGSVNVNGASSHIQTSTTITAAVEMAFE